MRTAFINQLLEEARHNERVFLIVGDLGYSVVEPFAQEFPDRFLNVGIAEQNMAGVAAGLAMTGYNVYIYSIGNFPTLRCFEQIRRCWICVWQSWGNTSGYGRNRRVAYIAEYGSLYTG